MLNKMSVKTIFILEGIVTLFLLLIFVSSVHVFELNAIYVMTFGVFSIIISSFLKFKILNNIPKKQEFEELIYVIVDYLSYKSNEILIEDLYSRVKSNDIKELINNLKPLLTRIEKLKDDDMAILGEIVIAMDKASQGVFTSKIEGDSNNGVMLSLKNTINKMLKESAKNLDNLINTIEKYSNNDYRARIEIDLKIKGRMKDALINLNKLGNELSSSTQLTKENSLMMLDNSNKTNNALNDLQKSANNSASSLKETSTALEEITSLTRGNSQNALKMTNMSKEVENNISNGQILAKETAKAMDEINEKVRMVNEAIEVIDQIAFQTNILSLNAAVEAATAGEAGKGFAVVAQEVRNLASRSAEAAKQIKDLVEEANNTTINGKKISDNMLEDFDKLNTTILNTIDTINDVNNASKEQLTGIEQINNTVNNLDNITQRNAEAISQIRIYSQANLEEAKKSLDIINSKKI